MNFPIDFIRANIKIRENEISFSNPTQYNLNSRCLNLLSSTFDSINIFDSIDNDILYRISSKSFYDPNKIISNRILGLQCILTGINFTTGKQFDNISFIKQYKYFIVAIYLIAGQIFTDGNHRVCQQYLNYQGFPYDKSINIIKIIDNCRRIQTIDWENIHEFIQKIINNLAKIITNKNENLILEKIENLFI